MTEIRAEKTTKILKSALNCKTTVLDNLSEQNIYGAYPDLDVTEIDSATLTSQLPTV